MEMWLYENMALIYGGSLLHFVPRERFVKSISLRMERTISPFTSFLGVNNSDRKLASAASNRPQTTHKTQ